MPDNPRSVPIRRARPDDAPQAGLLIHDAAPVMFNLLFGPQSAQSVQFFQRSFVLPGHPFSFEHAWVAEQEGQVVGLAMAAPVAERRRIGRRLFWLIPRLRGPLAMLRRLPDTLPFFGLNLPPPPDAFYLSILAVEPARRGQGLGSALLDTIIQQSLAAGFDKTVLHVETDNAAAQRFYRRHGFAEQRRQAAGPRLARKGITGFVEMIRPTASPP